MSFNIQDLIKQRHISNVFQPVYQLSHERVVGYESLMRCGCGKSPEVLFRLARKKGVRLELDQASIQKAIHTYSKYCQQKKESITYLSVNVFPSTLVGPFFVSFIKKVMEELSYPVQRIALEINESEWIQDLYTLKKVIEQLRQHGFLIALDDVGKGNHSLETVTKIEPDIVKLDRFFTKDLSHSTKKQQLLADALSTLKGSYVILEGIETKEELDIAKVLGVEYGQGYYLGRPSVL